MQFNNRFVLFIFKVDNAAQHCLNHSWVVSR